DGIRDFHVTGVQTCALPICTRPEKPASLRKSTVMARAASSPVVTLVARRRADFCRSLRASQPSGENRSRIWLALCTALLIEARRSEERRVGKEGRAEWRRAE